MLSDCCNCSVLPETDICSNCKEHCGVIRDDETILKTPIEELTENELERGAEICNKMNSCTCKNDDTQSEPCDVCKDNDITGELQEGFCN